jgi:hypothetical protein
MYFVHKNIACVAGGVINEIVSTGPLAVYLSCRLVSLRLMTRTLGMAHGIEKRSGVIVLPNGKWFDKWFTYNGELRENGVKFNVRLENHA